MSLKTFADDRRVVAVVLAAGQGTRMRSSQPKVLHTVLGRPVVHFSVEAARAIGVTRIVVVVGHGREEVEASVRAVAPNAEFAVQAAQRGTADAVSAARPLFGNADYVLVLSGDVPGPGAATLEGLIRAVEDAEAPLGVVAFVPADATGYGRCVSDDHGRLAGIVEHKDAVRRELSAVLAETRCNAGIYLAKRTLLEDVLGLVQADNAQGELYLTDIARLAHEAGTPGVVFTVKDPGEVEGINDRAQLAVAEERARRLRNLGLMQAGVTLRDPSRTTIGFEVEVEPDVEIAADVLVTGRSRIAEGARIGQGCVLQNAVVGQGAELLPYCVVTDATVGTSATVGPFAHLRPGTVLGEKAKIGNFVETKNARLARGAKANHLTYLGDCTIGADSNIGAGTITCNYDGVEKHKTVIGERVFVGSNTEIVAPRTIGDDAVVGAGSTLTRDVPAGALALTRVEQVIVEGWSYRRGPWARKKLAGKV